jgi:hypothetical protein
MLRGPHVHRLAGLLLFRAAGPHLVCPPAGTVWSWAAAGLCGAPSAAPLRHACSSDGWR